jgi:hypothetical protein
VVIVAWSAPIAVITALDGPSVRGTWLDEEH